MTGPEKGLFQGGSRRVGPWLRLLEAEAAHQRLEPGVRAQGREPWVHSQVHEQRRTLVRSLAQHRDRSVQLPLPHIDQSEEVRGDISLARLLLQLGDKLPDLGA